MSMKTKFLRFNKLPKIDSLNPQSPDKFKESDLYNPHDHQTSSPLRKDTMKGTDFYDLFENIIKRMSQHPNYVL